MSIPNYNIGYTIYLLRTDYDLGDVGPKSINPRGPYEMLNIQHLCIAFNEDKTIPLGICTLENIKKLQPSSIGYFWSKTGQGRLIIPDPLLTRNIKKSEGCNNSSFEILSKRVINNRNTKVYIDRLLNPFNYNIIYDDIRERIDIYQGSRYSFLARLHQYFQYLYPNSEETDETDETYWYNHTHNCVTWVMNFFPDIDPGILGIPRFIQPYDSWSQQQQQVDKLPQEEINMYKYGTPYNHCAINYYSIDNCISRWI